MTTNTPDPRFPQPSPAPRADPLVSWIVALLFVTVVGTVLFGVGYAVGGGLDGGGDGGGTARCAEPSDAFASFCEAYERLKDEYVDPLDDTKLAEGALRGLFEFGVEDPYSSYMAPDAYQQARQDLSGRFEGIGAEMGPKNLENPDEQCTELSETCVLTVVAPIADSPAEAAGLRPGDIVRAVDGEPVAGSTMQDQINRVRGPAGTEVTLEIERDGETLEFTITRAEIVIKEVEARMLEDGVGYISLRGFSDKSDDEFRDGLEEILSDGAEQIVFDLRNNPGGYIVAAQQIASQFLDDGVVFTQESHGEETQVWEVEDGGLANDPSLDVVVLTNGGSASASEIVAAALQEHGRATVIGEPTFGKNTVQVWAPLENEGGVRITISRWFTPEHRSVAPDGLQPDVVVEVPPDAPAEPDIILERALAFLETNATGDSSSAQPPPIAAEEPGAGVVVGVGGPAAERRFA